MDSLEATVRIIEAMLTSDQCPPPFRAARGQAFQREAIAQDHAQMDSYRHDFVELFQTVLDSVVDATESKAK